jgi:DNA-nicking Smr family endonuclease
VISALKPSFGLSDMDYSGSDPVEIPIDGTLDLHAFRPAEVRDLVREYLAACREREILQVRIIHGKGPGP